jgi:hypothetical protein
MSKFLFFVHLGINKNNIFNLKHKLMPFFNVQIIVCDPAQESVMNALGSYLFHGVVNQT